MKTKKGTQMYLNSLNHDGYDLNDIYGKYSNEKKNAYASCRKMCIMENGTSFHIYSHNTFGFSVTWYVENGTRIATPSNSYLIVNE